MKVVFPVWWWDVCPSYPGKLDGSYPGGGPAQARLDALPSPSVVWTIEEGQECPLSHSSRCPPRWVVACHRQPLRPSCEWRPLRGYPEETCQEKVTKSKCDTGCASDMSAIWSPQKMLVQLFGEAWEWYLGMQGQRPGLLPRCGLMVLINWGDWGGTVL